MAGAPCPHANFEAHVVVQRFEDMPGVFMAEIRVRCAECGTHMQFVGGPIGLSFTRPTIGTDATELRAPLVQPGTQVAPQVPEYTMRAPRAPKRDGLN